MGMIKIRASSTPGRMLCPSWGHTGNPHNPESEPAQQGSAAHMGIEHYINSRNETGQGEILDGKTAQLHFPLADPDETEILTRMAKNMFYQILERIEEAGETVEAITTESGASAILGDVDLKETGNTKEVVLTGTCDLLIKTNRSLYVYDWKFGRESGKTHFAQTAAYGLLAANKHGIPSSGVITVGEAHVRHGHFDECMQHLDENYLMKFVDVLLEQVSNRGVIKKASTEACKFCPARLECKQWPKMLHEAKLIAEALAGCDNSNKPSLQVLADSRGEIKAVENAVKLCSKMLKSGLESANAHSKDAEAHGVYLAQVKRTSLKLSKAKDVLKKNGLTDEQIANASSLSQASIKKLYPLGEWKEVEKELDEAGAIVVATSTRITKA